MTEQAGQSRRPEASCIDSFCIDAAHPSLAGHFPGNPVVPGVLLLDHVLAAIEAVHGAGYAIRLPQIKFLRPLLPGEQARIVLEDPVPIAAAGNVASRDEQVRVRFRVERGEAVLASGEVVMALTDAAATMALAT